MGFVLPWCDVDTVMTKQGMETSVRVGKAGVYCGACSNDEEMESVLEGAVSKVLSNGGGNLKKRMSSLEKNMVVGQQATFLVAQNAVRDKMQALTEKTAKWSNDRWFFCLATTEASTDDGKPAAVTALVSTDLVGKANADHFSYEKPIAKQCIEIFDCELHASESQFAALMSLSTHAAEYKLWSNHVIMRQLLAVPAEGVPPRLRWKAATRAVQNSIKKGTAQTSFGADLTKIIHSAKLYKEAYAEFCSSAGYKENTAIAVMKQAHACQRW